MRLCSHVIKEDTGLAPNPFHNYCTSALCTPSHMNATLKEGNWLIGTCKSKLVYAMCISEVLCMNSYFNDCRFMDKKPKIDGDPEDQCGDNIYFKKNNVWKRHPSRFHNNCQSFMKDVGNRNDGRSVFISKHFYYFGDQKVQIPEYLLGVIWGRQGIRYVPESLADKFVIWLEGAYPPGRLGVPAHLKDHRNEQATIITDWNVDCVSRAGSKSNVSSQTVRAARGCG